MTKKWEKSWVLIGLLWIEWRWSILPLNKIEILFVFFVVDSIVIKIRHRRWLNEIRIIALLLNGKIKLIASSYTYKYLVNTVQAAHLNDGLTATSKA